MGKRSTFNDQTDSSLQHKIGTVWEVLIFLRGTGYSHSPTKTADAAYAMTFSRRDFLKRSGLTVGAMNLPSCILDSGAAEASLTTSDKNNLADIATVTA